jgi:hypothetical protein
MRGRGSIWIVVVGLAGIPAGARAQSVPLPITGELQVNQAVTDDQDSPSVGMRDDGTHVVVWRSLGQDGDGTGIVSRKFPGDGSAPFNESVLNQATAGNQRTPSLGMNAAGDWLAVWVTTAAGQGLRGRTTSNGGTTLGAEFEVSQTTAPGVQIPSASRADDGSFVAAWEIVSSSCRRFDAAGGALTGDFDPAPSLGNSFRPALASSPAGDFVVALEAGDSDDVGIFLQRFDAGGDPVGDVIPVAATDVGHQFAPDVGEAADGSLVVVWTDGSLGARARCFTAAGVARGGEIAVDAGFLNGGVRVAVAPGGSFVVTFPNTDILAREYDRTCRPVGPVFTVNTTSAGFQGAPAVAAGSDRFVVAWHTENLDGDGLGIARRLFRLRSIFADDFERGDRSAWSATQP